MEILKLNSRSKPVKLLLTIFIGLIGALFFIKIHMPLPWVLGPMIALLIGSKVCKIEFYWPAGIRDWGLIIIGYASGLSINRETFFQIIQQLPWMLLMTVLLIAFGAVTALFISKLTGVDYPSILTGGIPGGLTQMVVLGEEMKGMDLTVITFLQVVRLMLIVFCIPLIVFSPFYNAENVEYTTVVIQAAEALPMGVLIPKVIIFSAVSVLSAFSAKKLRFPTPYLLGPILGIAIASILGFQGPALSPILLDIAQFTMGCYLGLLLKPEKLENKFKIVSLSILNGVVLILFALVQSYILVKMHGLGAATSFLCLAPGGADQMGVIASVISADVSMVTGYQLFRMLFVNFAVPPMLKYFYRYYSKVKQATPETPSIT